MVKAQESKAKGFFFGILAAVSYGVNPLGAKYLYEEGFNVESVLIVCAVSMVLFSLTSPERHLMPLATGREWGYSLMLAIVPTVFSLVSMGIAVRIIGSTPTAIMGALEPLTAVVIGLTVFHEALTVNLVAGILLILTAVITIILSKGKATA